MSLEEEENKTLKDYPIKKVRSIKKNLRMLYIVEEIECELGVEVESSPQIRSMDMI